MDYDRVTLDQENFATQRDAVSVHGVIPSASVELTLKHVDTRRDQTLSRYATLFPWGSVNRSMLLKGRLRIYPVYGR